MEIRKVTFEKIVRADGTNEFDDFMSSLPDKDKAKLASTIDKIEQFGMIEAYAQQWVKKLRDGICEIRSKQGSDIQRVLYFQRVGNVYVITHGFTKKTDKTPSCEIEHAKNAIAKYLKEVQK